MPLKRMKNAQAKLKRMKSAQTKLDDALQTYYRHYGACEQLADDVKDKFAERSSASLDAIITLGQVATFMGQIPIANQVNRDPFDATSVQTSDGVTSDQTSDWKSRSKIAADLMQTLASFGVGAAGISGLWALAGTGVASTGAVISSLNGAAAITAKLAALGGGAIAAGGGGMLLGAAVFGGIPVALGVTAFGIISIIRSSIRSKKHADAALKKIAAAECELTRWREEKNLTILRTNELTGAEESLTHALQQLLVQCSPNNPSGVQTVASISSILAQLVDIPITDEDGNLLNEDALKNVYRKHVLGARQDELFKAYRRLREAIAGRAYDDAIRVANHILSIIKL